MPSPFLGMDPFIEARRLFEDLHNKLIVDIDRALSERLPSRYVVRSAERSYGALLDVDEVRKTFIPDVAIVGRRGSRATPAAISSARVSRESDAACVTMRARVKAEFRETYLEIFQTEPKRKLVTGIEVLSPSNKRRNTKGWRLYNRKRDAYLSGRANFVEIDLLRLGQRMPMISEWPESPYYLLVCRKKQAPRCSVWPAFSITPLPSIPIPLSPPDPDIQLELQPLLDAIYTRSRYEQDIDYRQKLELPFSEEERAWLESRLREQPGKKAKR